MLNLASFGPAEHQLIIQSGIEGLRDILDLDLDDVPGTDRTRAPRELGMEPPTDLTHRGLVGPGQDARGRVDAASGAESRVGTGSRTGGRMTGCAQRRVASPAS